MPKPKKINLDKLHKLLEVKRGVEAMRQDLVNRTEFVIPKVGIDYFTPEEQKAWFDAISEYVDKLFVEQSTEFFSPETLEDIKTLVLNDVVKLIKDGKDGKDGKDAVVDYDSIIGRVVSELDLPDYEKLIERTVKKIDSIEEKTKTFASKEAVEQIKEEVKSLEINLNQRINLAPRTAGGGSNVTVKLNGALVGSGTILDFSGSGVSSITHNGNTASINISGGGAGVSDGDKGDITVSGSGTTWTIDNLAVTNAKINDVAWSKVSGTPTTLAGYGISDTKANFNSALSDGDFLFSGDITQYTDEMAQDAVGGMVANSTFVNLAYVDGTPSLTASLSATGTPSASTFLRGDNTWASISASPGGSDTQLQYNNSGSFAGISGATSNGTNVTFGTGNLLVQDVKASGSGGVAIKNSSGTTVADFGAGSSTNISLVGAVNMGTGSADYAQYSGGTGVVTNTATGSSTNIDITVVPKGTGKFKVTGDANISGLTASQILATNASKDLVSLSTATYPDLTELSYVKGVTSSIQTQLGNKQPLDTQLTALAGLSYTGNASKYIRVNATEDGFELATVAGGTIDGSGIANEITYWVDTDTLGSLTTATYPSLTELSYVKGVTSSIQTQLGNKQPLDADLTDLSTKWTTASATGAASLQFHEDTDNGTNKITLTAPASLTSDVTVTLPSSTGTLALTSDIPSLSGYVNTTGTPANNQIAIFTDADTVEGDSSLTYDGTSFNLATAKNFQIAGATILADAAGTTTLSNIDALDATTEATIESAIDTLANLTSIQGRTVTLADAGADAIFGWDDSANQYANLSAADVRTALGLATTDSPQFTAINLGHASDTTLARVSAGVVSVEGKTLVNLTDGGTFLADISVPDEAYGSGWNASLEVPTKNAVYDKIETLLPLAGGTMTGNITLGENTSIALDPAGSADGKYSGITVTGTAGAALAFGDVVVLDVTDSRWELADANSAASADGDARGMIGICVLAAAGDGSATTILLQGIIRADAAFPALTVGAPVYLSETAGDVTLTKPTTTDAVVRTLGFALTADEMYWNPSSDYITVV